MAQDWFVVRDGKETGPYSPTQLKQMAATDKLAPTDQVRRSDMQAPRAASTIKGLFATASTVSAKSSPPPVTAPTPTAQKKDVPLKKILIIASALLGSSLLLCCGALGIISFFAPKAKETERNVIAQADKTAPKTPDNQPETKQPDRDGQQPQKPEAQKEVIEWVNDRGAVELYSDKPIPILYGVPDGVVRQMPPDQRRLFQSLEKLAEEANETAKEETNPALRQRLIEKITKQSEALTSEQNAITVENRTGKNPLDGWVGQIRLGSTEAVVSIGTGSSLTKEDIFYDYDIKMGKKKPPRTTYCAGGSVVNIILDTKLMSDAALAQVKGLKDGDWVKVDLPDARWHATALVRFAEKKRELKAVYGDLTIRESGAALYTKPRKDEPVIRKLSVVQ